MRNILIIILAIFSFVICVNGQNRTLTGRVISEDFDILADAYIQNLESVILGKADTEGRFEITIPVETNKLLIRFIGMESSEIELSNNCDVLEVVVMVDAIYDFMSAKRINRMRKKRFKKLHKIHKEAYNKGLFKTEKPCYTQVFPPAG